MTTWQCIIMIEKIRSILVINYAWMIGIAAFLRSHQCTLLLPRPRNAFGGRITDIFREFRSINKIILLISLVYPWSLGIVPCKSRFIFNIQGMNFAIKGNHVLLQFYPITGALSPEKIGLSVIIDKDGWIKIIPRMRSIFSHAIRYECLA